MQFVRIDTKFHLVNRLLIAPRFKFISAETSCEWSLKDTALERVYGLARRNMAEIPEWRKKVERRGETKREREREKAEERGEERKDPATVRYFLIDVDIWKTLRRTSMHRDNAMCLAYLEGASCIARFIARSFSTSSSILTLESARDPTIPCTRPRWTNISIKTSCYSKST